MKRYKVTISDERMQQIEVEAKDRKAARARAEEQYPEHTVYAIEEVE